MEFYAIAGQMALGSRLRHLADSLASDAQRLYQHYGVEIDPRWFPVFYMLTHRDGVAITELAREVGQTHPAVSQVVQEMLKAKVVTTQKCSKDARVSRVSLSTKGQEIAQKLVPQCSDVGAAVGDLLVSSGANLWADLEAVEYELKQKGLYERVTHARKQREGQRVSVVPYTSKYKYAFKALNVAWIEANFEIEPSDLKALDNPQAILKAGGYIAIACSEDEPIGTCALLKVDDETFEMAKMAVDESAKGKGIGFLLGEHVIEKAKELGAKHVFLESNSTLVPALNLYRKLGFKRVTGRPSPYTRCNIQMELVINTESKK